MSAREFDQQIVIQQRGAKAWQTVATLPARVTAIEGDDTITQKVTIRAYPLISADMRVLYKTAGQIQILQIRAIVEEQHGAQMALACLAVGALHYASG